LRREAGIGNENVLKNPEDVIEFVLKALGVTGLGREKPNEA